jgi:hypothetical protein
MYYKINTPTIENENDYAKIVINNADEESTVKHYLEYAFVPTEILLHAIKNDWGYDEITYEQFVGIYEYIIEHLTFFVFDALHDELGDQIIR